jgi:hypothetical protein
LGNKVNILEEAEGLINGERQQDYGNVTENFDRIAGMWSAYKDSYFTAHDVANMMAIVKIARLANGYHRDSVVDVAGYAALVERVFDEDREAREQSLRAWERRVAAAHDFEDDVTEFFGLKREARVVESLGLDERAAKWVDPEGHRYEWDASNNGWDRIEPPSSYVYTSFVPHHRHGPFTEVVE